ncbi:MAG: hypothetical protein NVSMB12_03390 [Acidimicrobiales bacterium]
MAPTVTWVPSPLPERARPARRHCEKRGVWSRPHFSSIPLEDGCVPEDDELEAPEELEEDLEEPEDIDESDLEDLDDDDLIYDEVLDDEVLDDDTADVVDDDAVEVPVAVVPDEDDDDDDDDEPEPDEIEATLDEILKERLVVPEEEDDDEEEDTPDTDDRGDGVGKVLPKQPDEFVCQSCFLVKHPSQLADAKRMWCRDCV